MMAETVLQLSDGEELVVAGVEGTGETDPRDRACERRRDALADESPAGAESGL